MPDLFLTAVKLSHDKTGAQYLHAARDDSNNLFRFSANQCLLCFLALHLASSPQDCLFPPPLFYQRPVQNHSHGQHGGSAHPGAHSAVWIGEVSLQRPLLQDAQQVAVHLHERLHRCADASERVSKEKVHPLRNIVVSLLFVCLCVCSYSQ